MTPINVVGDVIATIPPTAPPVLIPIPLTFADLRKNPSLLPDQTGRDSLLLYYSPLVHGLASALIPQDPAAHERIVVTTFELLAYRWKKVSKKTTIAAWLFRTTWFAIRKEQKSLARKNIASVADPLVKNLGLIARHILCLPPKLGEPLLLQFICQTPSATIAKALRTKEKTLAKRTKKGLACIAKKMRRLKMASTPEAVLNSLAVQTTPELSERLTTHFSTESQKQKHTDLFKTTQGSWRWFRFRRFCGTILRIFLTNVGILTVIGFILFWLATNGYLTLWFITFGTRQLTKEIPELLIPARPWPTPSETSPATSKPPPPSSSDLYTQTNIWLATLSFTKGDWKKLEPTRIAPVRKLHQPDGTLLLRNPKAKRSGLSGSLGFDFNWTQAHLEFAGVDLPEVAVRYRGNGTYVSSLFGSKQSFKVDLDKYNKGQELGGVHTLNLLNSVADDSYLHDSLAEQLFRDLGVPAPRTAYTYLNVDAPGSFTNKPLGLYLLMENIDSDFAENRFHNRKTPIFKPVTPYLFKDLGDDWESYTDIYDLKTKATPEQWKRVVQFSKLVTHADDAEFARRLPEFVKMEEFAGFLAGHVLLSSYDGFLSNGQNYYIYLDPVSSQFGFISWDQDHAWGEFPFVGNPEMREQASFLQPSGYNNRFLERVLKVEAFQDIYRKRIESALATYFNPEQLFPKIDRLAAIIRPAIAAESDFRLKRFDISISTNWIAGPRNNRMEGPKGPAHQLKRFIMNRTESLRDQLDGKSKGKILGGRKFGEKPPESEANDD